MSKKLFFLLLLFISISSSAQQATATLSGRVVDQQDAVIPHVKIKATLKATGTSRETETTAEGIYTITNLPVGEYEIKFEASGFRVTTLLAQLQVGQNATVNEKLEVGVATIDPNIIFDNVEPVNTNSAIIEGVVNTREITRLPLNGRNYLELALLIPGNAPAPNFDPTKTNTVLISSAGQVGRGGSVTIDGADNNDDVVGGSLHNVPQDAVQEFQMATSRFSAVIGRSGSSVINVVTKAGTNELHGIASIFERDAKLQGLPATYDRSNGKPPFDRQQYSFAIGGPLKKDRAWWFGAIEDRNQNGALLVGSRDTATRTIKRSFASAPLDDLIADLRGDWCVNDYNRLTFRYSIERSDDTASTASDRALGSASQRQRSRNHYQSFLTNYTNTLSATAVNEFRFSINNFYNRAEALSTTPQLTFPSLLDGSSFRFPQRTKQNRLEFSDSLSKVAGKHTLTFGADVQRIDAEFYLGVFQAGRIEFVEDFPTFDHNGDGKIDDNDLLFAATLRSAFPNRPLIIPDADNNHFAFFAQDDWKVSPRLTLNLGLRYELDTDVKNVSRVKDLNPLISSFLHGTRGRDKNNFAPRIGFNWSTINAKTSIHGGYGIYYDRITLEVQSLERGLDGRALPIEVRSGNVQFLDPNTGKFPPIAPTFSNPFTGFIFPGAGASGINIIDNKMQNPMVQQFNLGVQRDLSHNLVLRADYLHSFGTHFIIGRTIGTVNNPVVGGPDRVVNLESSVKTKYDGLLVSAEKRFSESYSFRASYTLSKAFNYSNDDQIPFANGPVNPNNLQLEYGPTPNDQRHRFAFAGAFDLPFKIQLSPIWTVASGVPMDILLPDGSSRIPVLQRNAGGRLFHSGAELNTFIQKINASGGVNGTALPLAPTNARFNDSFNSFDLRISRPIHFTERIRLEPIAEVFNIFNVTNILGSSNTNYSGFGNVLGTPTFGQPITTAGGVFGSGGPRAFQFAARFIF